jgi:1-acyl-sn-glycerol-3-phosphate acyltransferase
VSSVVYGILWVLSRTIGWLCFRYRVVGAVPRTGGFLVAANHASYLDIPLLGCGMRRRAWFLGRSDLFPVPGLKAFCQWLGWIPLRTGRLDRDAFGKAVALIKEGKVVVIFPEGSRSLDGQLQSPKPGIGVIVAQTGCSVVPAYLKGTFEALTFPQKGEGGDAKQFYQEVSRTVMDRIASLGGVESPTQQSSAGIRKAE